MRNREAEFEWYDAWVLAALIYACDEGTPVPLWRLIWIADALMKAIVDRDELELALTRLDLEGYVRPFKGGFEATQKAIALKAPGWPVGNVSLAIGAKSWSGKSRTAKTTAEAYVTSSQYKKALTKYRTEFAKK